MSGCSAVAIGPHLILTAGHVTAGNFLLGNQTYHMTSTEMAPSFNKKPVDLRVVQVSDTLPGWYQIAKTVSTKATVTMVGYGATGVVNAAGTGYTVNGGNGTRRAANNIINSKSTYDPGPSLVSMLEGAGESVLAGGDSGGGWFVGGQLVGISAFTLSTNTTKPDYGFSSKAYFGSGAIDLTNSALQNWLTATRGKYGAASGSGSRRSDGFDSIAGGSGGAVAAVPEPAPILSLGLGLILLRKRKRSAK